MSRLEFYGFPAWVGAITSPTHCGWWSTDPAQIQWDLKAQIVVNLAHTPAAAIAGKIKSSEVEVDDYTGHGGRNTIGPLWRAPTWSAAAGCAARCGRRSIRSTGRRFPRRARADMATSTRPCSTSTASRTTAATTGFHAKAVSAKGHLTLVELWNPGTGISSPAPAGSWWLDLAAIADPMGPQIDPATKPVGPVFLEQQAVRSLAVVEPKFPRFVGSFPFPSPQR